MISWIIAIGLCIATFLLLKLRSKVVNPPSNLSNLPTLPALVELSFKTDKLSLYKNHRSIFETPIVATRFPSWGIAINDARIAQTIYMDTKTYPKRDNPFIRNSFFGKVFGSNILNASGDEWKRHRRIVNPAFHRSWTTEHFGTLANRLLDEWSKIDNSPIEVQYWMQRLTLDALGLQGFNFDFNSIQDSTSKWVEDYHNIMRGMRKPIYIFMPFLDALAKKFPLTQALRDRRQEWKSLQDFDGLLYDMINKRLAEIQNSDENDENKDILTLMIESTKDLRPAKTFEDDDSEGKVDRKLTIKELRDDVFLFFVAGHDTTSFTLTSCIYNMAKYPDIQKKARQEVEDVLKGNDQRYVPSFEQQRKFIFVEAVIKETLRMYPPLMNLPFRSNSTEVEINNTKLPVGTRISVNIIGIQRNPAYWKDPDTFDPYRFYDDSTKQARMPDVPSCAWEPFGAGTRMCLGMNFSLIEQRTVLSMILRNYEFSLPEDSIHKEDIKVELGLLASAKPIPINFKRK